MSAGIKGGAFYYRYTDGESAADVYNRISAFMSSLHRKFQSTSLPQNIVIVSHGYWICVFLMRWYHLTVQAYDTMEPLCNCEFVVLAKDHDGRYTQGIQGKGGFPRQDK